MSSDPDMSAVAATAVEKPPRFYRAWFINRFGHVRAIWRVVLFALLTYALAKGLGWFIKHYPFPDEGDALLNWKDFAGRGTFTFAMIVAALLLLRWVDRRPISMLGLSRSPGWLRDFFLGIFFGLFLLCAVLTCLWVGGWTSLSLNELTPALIGGISKAFLMFFVAALLEEVLVRGYPFQVFIEGARPWIAVVLLSSLFSFMHFDNPDVTIPSALNIFLAGVLLSVAYLKTRSLWLPTGLHLGWNWMQASFWGMGVSGFHVEWSVFTAEAHGADWISGGKFGAEASIFATIGVSAAAYLLWKTDKFGVADELGKAWRKYPKGYGLAPELEARPDEESQ